MMRSVISWSACAALVLTGQPSFGAQQQQASRADQSARISPPQDQGFCRRPAALPQLEVERDRQIVVNGARTGRGRVETEAAPLASPPPLLSPPSPPPPPAPMASADLAAAEAGGGGSAETLGRSIAPPMPPPPGRPPQPRPQSGLLTAGEHDDLLNPELYADYVRGSNLGQRLRDLPVLDTSNLLRVEVRDNRGQPMPFVPVELACSDGNSITLGTMADGSVVFFPALDRLSDRVRVRAQNGTWRSVTLAREAGAQNIGITLNRRAAPVRQLDLALVVDVTGSMSDELRFLQSELAAIVSSLEQRHRNLDIRVGFVFYRDQGDQFVTRTYPLDGDMQDALRLLGAQRARGGGDYPEAMQDALIRAVNQPWRDDAVKTLLLVGDAPPHDQDVGTTWLAAQHLRAQRVHVVPVGASGVADMAEYLMRAMAAATQSRYTFLTDDSGIGNAHAKPAIDCYLVTRLDQLLRRVIDSQISGRRVEPEDQEIIRFVGQYDAGRCILPADFGQEG